MDTKLHLINEAGHRIEFEWKDFSKSELLKKVFKLSYRR